MDRCLAIFAKASVRRWVAIYDPRARVAVGVSVVVGGSRVGVVLRRIRLSKSDSGLVQRPRQAGRKAPRLMLAHSAGDFHYKMPRGASRPRPRQVLKIKNTSEISVGRREAGLIYHRRR